MKIILSESNLDFVTSRSRIARKIPKANLDFVTSRSRIARKIPKAAIEQFF